MVDDCPVTAPRPEGDPADREAGDAGREAGDTSREAADPRQDRRRLVDLTRVEAGEPERRAPFRRFTEGGSER
jgi:hypothetical protein